MALDMIPEFFRLADYVLACDNAERAGDGRCDILECRLPHLTIIRCLFLSGVEKVVDEAKSDFHAGRPGGNLGPPVSLFNPALGLFDYHLSHLDDEPPIVDTDRSSFRVAHFFMHISATNCH